MGDITYDYENQNGNGQPHPGDDDNIIRFPPNKPVKLTMKYAKPRATPTRRGTIRYMITTVSGEVAFLDADPALKIEHLAIKPREPFWVQFKSTGSKGDLGSWDVWLDPAAEEARAKKNPQPAPAIAPTPAQPVEPAARPKTQLEDALQTVVDACHKAQVYAQKIGYTAMPQFTGEDIRAMANTLMIGRREGQ